MPKHPTDPTPMAAPATVDALVSSTNGLLWAREFCRVTGFADPDWALAWFASAIMAGYDEAQRRSDREICEFCGWLSGDLPELHSVEVPRIADSLARFRQRTDELAADEKLTKAVD